MTEAVRIGIVDSGVQPGQRVQAARGFALHEGQVREDAAQPDQLGHGSRLLALLQARAPDATVYAAQVFFQRLASTPAQLTAALWWLLEQRVQLINLSLGLRQDHGSLRDVCRQASARGIILCASTPARGDPVWPAAYSGVLRVTGDARCQAHQFSWLDSRYADLGGCVRSGDARLVGASVGCAHLSGHIAGYLCRQGDPAALLEWLQAHAAFNGPERRSSSGHGV